NKEDFKLHIDENNDLVISMEKREEKKEESDGDQKPRYLRREFSYSKFRQTLILPENVDHDKIEASMNDGVLTIQIKKLTPEELKKSTREITIK
ncbi:MAG: Hsp20/alpha crystallin family protein, partial [Porphyromonadaceae bacterium]|nr:Hsp20/alpha crystallin family protein [Porphyromonadaceae bacterium]